jgi:uncharacterized protein YbaR (Trm112 family)
MSRGWEKVEVEIAYDYDSTYFTCPGCKSDPKFLTTPLYVDMPEIEINFEEDEMVCKKCKTEYRIIWHVEKKEGK